MKINFNGTSKGIPGISGVGCVGCDDEGKIFFTGARRLRGGTNNEAEAQAALLAVELATI